MKVLIKESQYKFLLEIIQNPSDIKSYPSCVSSETSNKNRGELKKTKSGQYYIEVYTHGLSGFQFYNNNKVMYPNKKTTGKYNCGGSRNSDIIIDGHNSSIDNFENGVWKKIEFDTATNWEKKELNKISDYQKRWEERVGPVLIKIGELRRDYPIAFDLVLWISGGFLGRLVVAGLQTYSGYQKLKEGYDKKDNELFTQGVVETITGPVSFAMAARFLGLLGMPNAGGTSRHMLTIINKSGVPLLMSEGMESFYKWGFKNFGINFSYFMRLMNNENGYLNKLLVQSTK